MTKTRRRRWLVVLAVALALVAGVLAYRAWFAPQVPEPDPAEIPEAWYEPPVEVTPRAPDMEVEDPLPDEEPAAPKPPPIPVGYVQTGRLAYELDGRRVADETYRIERLESGRVELTSDGAFTVRVVLVNVSVTFSQEIALDAELRPSAYRLETRGPLGLGNQRITVTVDGARALATSGDEQQEIQVPDGNAFFLGTLAAYALLPALHTAWSEGDVVQLEAVGGGGGPPGGSRGGSAAAGTVEVHREGTTEIEVSGRLVVLDRYEVQSGGFAGTLLARGLEFVAFLGRGERPFSAYRSDLFPRGLPAGRTP